VRNGFVHPNEVLYAQVSREGQMKKQ